MNLAIGSIRLQLRKFVALRAALPVRPPQVMRTLHDVLSIGVSGFVGLWLSVGGWQPYSPAIVFIALGATYGLRDDDDDRDATRPPIATFFDLATQSLPLVALMLVILFASDRLGAGMASGMLAWWCMALSLLTWVRHHTPRTPPSAGTAFTPQDVPSTLAAPPISDHQRAQKRMLDIVISGLVLLLAMPGLMVIALLIRLDTPGPILFRQRRHGHRSGEFEIYKFRTMRVAPVASAEAGLQQTRRNDDRVTRVGRVLRKYSLDELPQLLNVLEGTMSLVGPRPHAVNMRTEDRLGEQIIDDYLMRHRLLPGITGLSQVRGLRGATDTMDQLRRRVELDLDYIEHWSVLLDLKILLLTFGAVMKATHAY